MSCVHGREKGREGGGRGGRGKGGEGFLLLHTYFVCECICVHVYYKLVCVYVGNVHM